MGNNSLIKGNRLNSSDLLQILLVDIFKIASEIFLNEILLPFLLQKVNTSFFGRNNGECNLGPLTDTELVAIKDLISLSTSVSFETRVRS